MCLILLVGDVVSTICFLDRRHVCALTPHLRIDIGQLPHMQRRMPKATNVSMIAARTRLVR